MLTHNTGTRDFDAGTWTRVNFFLLLSLCFVLIALIFLCDFEWAYGRGIGAMV